MKQSPFSRGSILVIAAAVFLAGCARLPIAAPGGGNSGASASAAVSGSAVSGSSSSEPDAPEVVWAVEPLLECDAIMPIDAVAHNRSEGLATLALFEKNGQYGVADQTGKVVFSEAENMGWCSLCGLVDGEHVMCYADGSKTEVVGHGGAAWDWVYDAQRDQVVNVDGYGELSDAENPGSDGFSGVELAPVVNISGDYSFENERDNAVEIRLATEGDPAYRLVDCASGRIITADTYTAARASSEVSDDLEKNRAYRSLPVVKGFTARQAPGAWSFFTQRGEKLPFGPYEDAKPFHSGFAAVKQNGSWGYIDENGAALTPFVFEDAASGYAGKAWAKQDGLWGVVQVTDAVAPPPASTSTDIGATAATSVSITADGGLRLRSQPSSDGEVLELIPTGTIVDVLETENGWLKVSYNGATGWISAEYTVGV